MKSGQSFLDYKYHEWFRDFTSLANPIVLLAIPFFVLGPSKIYYSLLLALLINEIFCSLIKFFYHKARPKQQEFSGALEKIDAGSFPSIHASRISLCYLTLFAFAESQAVGIGFLLVIFLVAYSRVILKKHFWIDVLGGLFIGTIIFLMFNHFVY